MSEGKVVAVCLSTTGGVPKQTQEQIKIGPHGVDGDLRQTRATDSRRSAGRGSARRLGGVGLTDPI